MAAEAKRLAETAGRIETPETGAQDCPEPEALLRILKEREEQLNARADRIVDRERLLEVAEAKYKDQMARLKAAEDSLSATLALADKAAEKDIARLVEVYESMKPKNAARIIETMDVTFAAGILSRMNGDAAARIMSGMNADRAYAVSVVIAGRNADVPTE